MSKKKKKPIADQNSRNLLDKLVDQTFMLILSFIFTTALISGCGYALFQFPSELDSINRDLLEFSTKSNQLDSFNEILDIATKGWLADQNEKNRMSTITQKITNNIHAKNFDTAFVTDSLEWITNSLVKISLERGKVKGYQVVGEVEQNLQHNLITEYDYQINILNETDSIIRNWVKENPTERDKRLETLQNLLLNSVENLSGIESNASQLKSQSELDLKIYGQKTQELNTRIYIVYLKYFLSVIGIIISVAIFFLLGKAFFKKINAFG